MSPELIIIVVAVIVVPIVLAIVFKTLYKVPSADQALIITGAGAKGPTAGTEGGRTRSSPAAARSSSR